MLHPDVLDRPDDYLAFCLAFGLTSVSFSVDEQEGRNRSSSFEGADHKPALARFVEDLLGLAFEKGHPLRIREVERVASILAGRASPESELNVPWRTFVVAANGAVSTFSPELMEARSEAYGDFVFGDIVRDEIATIEAAANLRAASAAVAEGVAACATCRYFAVCGGGSPVNKFCERGSLAATETEFCRLSTQASADALMGFLRRRPGAAYGRAAA